MKLIRFASFCLLSAMTTARAAGDFLDRIENTLTWSLLEDRARARVSGTFDAEGYDLQRPAPGVIQTTGSALFSPRLTVFLDAQFGRRIYVFAQARADRGFDPGEQKFYARLDEYALRYTPWRDGRLSLQFGRFATVIGNWTARHGSWSDPFITAPLPYENLTGIWDAEAVRSSSALLAWSHVRPGLPAVITAREKQLRLPLVWGPAYAAGVAASGAFGRFRYAVELKNASISSRPETWRQIDVEWAHPAISTRLGYQPNEMWNFGVSASEGTYLWPEARRTLAPGHGFVDYREPVLVQDIGFAWRHLQVWTEIYATRFEIPVVGNADTVAYYAEAKYKFTPQFFSTVPDRSGLVRWGQDVWRIDLAPSYRFSPHTQLKLQFSLQRGDSGVRDYTRTMAEQYVVRF
ncbi:MAG: hypothetical protein EXS38_07570 [Opitutus sp.]|nr:hypothetical protein [Opitutus sp.]